MLTDRRRVHEQPHLRFHRVDDHRTGLEVSELIAQRLVDAEIANERTETGETAVAGQPRVCLSGVDIAGVSAADSARSAVPISALASERISTHLLGARRGPLCLHRNNHQCSRRASFQAISAILGAPITLALHRVRETQVEPLPQPPQVCADRLQTWPLPHAVLSWQLPVMQTPPLQM
jgi:hypothetical protein